MVSVFRVVLCAGLLAASGATIAAAPQPAKQSRVLGGYNSVAVDDPAAIAAATYAASQTGQEGASLDTIYSAERQSAAGTNWRLDFTLDNSSHWQAVVRQSLDGSWSVTSIDEIGE